MKTWKPKLIAAWYLFIRTACTKIFFSRVTVLHSERLPTKGPAIYLALHRNGAIDGFVYNGVLPRMTAMLSRQLRNNFFVRLFFDGIEVVRKKDLREGESCQALNQRALRQCVELLEHGGELLMFPEGTSSLGPSHLPFKGGAAHIAAAFLERHEHLTVVPVGIRYERPWAFRSRVEVTIGEPVPTQSANVRELRRRFNRALEDVGINVDSPARQERIQKLASVATLGTSNSYYQSLKRFESSIPERLDTQLDGLESAFAERRLLYHQGIPLFPSGARWPYLLALGITGPVVAAAVLVNAVPMVAGWTAARAFADDRNVIALWKILVGVPLFLLWVPLVTGLCLAWGPAWLPAAYLGLTGLGLALFYRVKKLAVAAYNGLFHAALRPRVLAFHQAVLSTSKQPQDNHFPEEPSHAFHPIPE